MLKKSFTKLAACFLSFVLFGCNGSFSETQFMAFSQPENKQKKASWTVMVYISGDNDLEEYVVKDLEAELGLLGSSEAVQVVALADRTPGYDKSRGDWTETLLFHVKKGLLASPKEAVASWGEKNFGDPQTLTDFVDWSKKNYPAERYALYFWGHGWNWRPGYTMEDQTNKDALDPPEIREFQKKHNFLDLVAYDGCNMGSIEVQALWYKHAAAIVHSQEYVDMDGIEYDVVLKNLQANPKMNAEQLAVVTTKSASLNSERTGSAVVLDQRWEEMVKAVDQLSLSLIKGLPKYRKNYEKVFAVTQRFEEIPEDQDLFDLAVNLEKLITDPEIKKKSRILKAAIKKVVLEEWHVAKYPNAHGITISRLKGTDPLKSYYKKQDFANYTNWDEFFELYKK